MNAWATIRKATNDDDQKLSAAAVRFIARHGLTQLDDQRPVQAVECGIDQDAESYPGEFSRLRKLWRAVIKRALGHTWAEGIAYGYVGYHQT